MKPTKTPLTDGVISVSVKDRISADGKTIRQKRFIRAAKNPTTSTSTSKPPKRSEPPAAPTTAAETAPSFTAEQDAQLLDLKSKNTSWKQISIMMDGKPQWQLKDRFKELSSKAVEGVEKKDEAKTADEKKKEEEEEKKQVAAEEKKKASEERKKAWEEKKMKEEAEKEKGREKGSGGGGGEAKAGEAKEERKIIFVDDGRFSLDEIVLVHKLAERYDNRKWLEVASKFFDTTGKRVHPDEMRDALGGGAK